MYKTSSGQVPFRQWPDLEIPYMYNRNLSQPLTSGGALWQMVKALSYKRSDRVGPHEHCAQQENLFLLSQVRDMILGV